jgi:hypothetical protein
VKGSLGGRREVRVGVKGSLVESGVEEWRVGREEGEWWVR